MLRWSVHVFFVLFAVKWTKTVYGGRLESLIETDEDSKSHPLINQVMALIEKINKQDDRLQNVETLLAKHTVALAEKDRRIYQLEQELAEVQSRMASSHATSRTTETNQTGKDQTVLGQTGPRITGDRPKQYQPKQNQTTRIGNHVNDVDEGDINLAFETINVDIINKRKLMTPERVGDRRPSSIQRPQKLMQQENRVDNTSPGGYAFSLSLSGNKQFVAQEIIKYDDVLLDTGNDYNHGDGIYDVPASGVYVFTWSIRSAENNGGSMKTQLLVNGVVMSATDADSDAHNFESATGLIVTSVSAGDHVFIRVISTGQVISISYDKSTFSGWRLF